MNGRRRDDLANDIDKGHPTISPAADALAAEVSRLSTFNKREEFSSELGRLAAASPSSGEWWGQTDRYLGEFDSTGVDEIKTFLSTRRDALLQRARERGWDVPAE